MLNIFIHLWYFETLTLTLINEVLNLSLIQSSEIEINQIFDKFTGRIIFFVILN